MGDLMETLFDCIVVGSGPAGVMSAQTLVEAGKKVLMIDGGIQEMHEDPGWTDNFTRIRKYSVEQERMFLGNNMELLDLDADKGYGQMTPQRRHVLENVHSFLPVSSKNISILESLSTGGLGNAWGLGCFTFSEAELCKAQLDPQKIRNAYKVVAQRIGISYTADDILPYAAEGLTSLQPSIQVDDNAAEILARYKRKKSHVNKLGFFAGVPPLALLTAPDGYRKATDYSNLDFHYNFGSSAYRPSVTLEVLYKYDNFVHRRGVIVTSFSEEQNFVVARGIDRKTNTLVEYKARKLLLACNVFGTARIVLRSKHLFETAVPVLSNPYSMLTTLQWRRLGKVPSDRKTSTAQVCLFFDQLRQHNHVPIASLYSYSSLMLFRLLKKSPLNFRDSRRILQYLQPALVIAGIHHPSDSGSATKAQLKKDGTLEIFQGNNDKNTKEIDKVEKLFARVLRQLGCIPIKKVVPPQGSSAHYGGTLPFSNNGSPLSLSREGLLAGTKSIYVADASGFHYLPAKGPTLTIMANAHNVALSLISNEQ